MARDRKSDRERLLKLIDGAPPAAAETGTAHHESAGTAAKRVRMGIDTVMSGLRRGSFDRNTVLLWVNRGLVAALAGVVIYGLFDLSRAVTGANKMPALAPPPVVQTASRPAAVSAELSGFAGIFDQSRVAGGSQSSAAAPAQQESISGLRLVGVDWGGDEPVALVEDKATGKTYFKKKDEKVGEWQVTRILRKKVVLSGPGGETEIQ